MFCYLVLSTHSFSTSYQQPRTSQMYVTYLSSAMCSVLWQDTHSWFSYNQLTFSYSELSWISPKHNLWMQFGIGLLQARCTSCVSANSTWYVTCTYCHFSGKPGLVCCQLSPWSKGWLVQTFYWLDALWLDALPDAVLHCCCSSIPTTVVYLGFCMIMSWIAELFI